MLFKVGKTGMVCRPQMPLYAACVASVSNRVIARKLEREQKDKKVEGGEGGEKRKRLHACKPHDSGKRPLIFYGSVHL